MNYIEISDEQRAKLLKHNIAKINAITPQFLKEKTPGVKSYLQCEIESAKLVVESLTASAKGLELPDELMSCVASLAAAISLLENGGKKAAASDKMFALMIEDYKKSLSNARSFITQCDNRLKK